MFGIGGTQPARIGKQFRVGCEVMSAQNKTGVLRKNEAGEYCDLVLGALEFPNSGGSTYSLTSGEDMLREGSLFRDCLTNGQAKGEYWHPEKEAGMSEEQWFRRIMYTAEKTTCHIHTSMWIDFIQPQGTNRKVPAFIGNIVPTGPYGDTLDKQLNLPKIMLVSVYEALLMIFNCLMVHSVKRLLRLMVLTTLLVQVLK